MRSFPLENSVETWYCRATEKKLYTIFKIRTDERRLSGMKNWIRELLTRKVHARLQDAAEASGVWQHTATKEQAKQIAEQLLRK